MELTLRLLKDLLDLLPMRAARKKNNYNTELGLHCRIFFNDGEKSFR